MEHILSYSTVPFDEENHTSAEVHACIFKQVLNELVSLSVRSPVVAVPHLFYVTNSDTSTIHPWDLPSTTLRIGAPAFQKDVSDANPGRFGSDRVRVSGA